LAYVGVRCARATASGLAVKQYLADNPLSLNLTLPPMRKGSEWPAFRFLKADGSWWKHLEAWRAVIVRDYVRVAKAYAATIEAAVASVGIGEDQYRSTISRLGLRLPALTS
jgi:hypothetical protein